MTGSSSSPGASKCRSVVVALPSRRVVLPRVFQNLVTFSTCLAAALLLFAATAAGGTSDPRKCDGAPAYCAQTASVVALRHYMAGVTGIKVWTSVIRCSSTAPSLLVWSCAFSGGRQATVTFRAFSNGWHTRVQVTTG